MANIKAIIADDEEELRKYLTSKLSGLWPKLSICGEAKNGLEALQLIEKNRPDLAFLDIKMPGLSGIEVAKQMTTHCRVVFITAYDQYAIEAFENEAIDYLLKPVTEERLGKTVKRLQKQLAAPNPDMTRILERLLANLNAKPPSDYLRWIRVRHGEEIRLVAVEEICYFKAEDKYTVVKTREGESLIKKSIQELAEELDPKQFWRIHRGTIIHVNQIAKVSRSFSGRLTIRLKDVAETLTVSRTYAHLFKQM